MDLRAFAFVALTLIALVWYALHSCWDCFAPLIPTTFECPRRPGWKEKRWRCPCCRQGYVEVFDEYGERIEVSPLA